MFTWFGSTRLGTVPKSARFTRLTIVRFSLEIISAYYKTFAKIIVRHVTMDPFLCCYILVWLRTLSARRQAMKTRRRRLQEARRRINALRKRAKKRSALIALAITLQSSPPVERRYWVVPTRYYSNAMSPT